MELLIVFLISLVATFLNSAHVIIQWILNKPGELFTGIPHFFADYFLYVGIMAQGASGQWIWAEHLFTNEPMAPTWYYWFYVSLGHLGSWVNLSPFATYNVSLFLLVGALCLVWYKLAKLLYPINTFLRLTTWLFILTVTNFFSFEGIFSFARHRLAKLDFSQGELLGQFWFSPSPVFARLGGVPYHAAQSILFILLAIIFSRILTMKSTSRITKYDFRIMKKPFASSFIIHNSLFIIPLAFLAGSGNPVQMLLFGAAAALTALLVGHGSVLRRMGIIFLILAAGGTGAMLSNIEFSRQAVFAAARAWELGQHVQQSLPILLLSIGPVLVFIPFAIPNVLKNKHPLPMMLTIWGVGSFLLFLSPFPRLMGLSPVRFLHPVPYAAALAILGTEGLSQVSVLLLRRWQHTVALNTIRIVLLAVFITLSVPAIDRQFTDRITPARNPQLLMDTIYNHVPAPITEALSWLKVTGLNPVNSAPVVLVDPAIPIEVLVPVITGLPSFSGHPIHTLYPDVKEAKRQEFFGGKMSTKDAEQFLKDHRVGYIVTTPARQLPITLDKAFSNTMVTIYQ